MVNKAPQSVEHFTYIALGSNLGLSLSSLKSIPKQFETQLSENHPLSTSICESVSPYFQTPAFPENSGPDFVNAAFIMRSNLEPQKLLQELHKLEHEFNRERPYRWAPRTLDLDLIFYDDLILPDQQVWQNWAALSLKEAQSQTPEELILPHPRAHERAFVLGPLREIAADFYHPALNEKIEKLWQALPEADRSSLKRL